MLTLESANDCWIFKYDSSICWQCLLLRGFFILTNLFMMFEILCDAYIRSFGQSPPIVLTTLGKKDFTVVSR